ncbi:Imm42 family immunity protein [Capnocytophaga sp.]|uniref:Imm42 family immunity protein n=1 Tax=Capnocytophaga sp. TaxID=44737 RepID=UPI0026DAE32D|nr:Imm42 family immunity protein [Capnocytophaga sp.]MDO5106533.1 Imm42 family immunity protein [Capnocytophaga sp.]
MLFGQKEQFAIEATLSQNGAYVFINYCFWVKSQKIGDDEQTALLKPVNTLINNVLKGKGKRKINADLPAFNDATDSLIQVLWETSDTTQNQWLTDKSREELLIFDIGSHHDECLQGFFVFLIEKTGYDLILCKIEAENRYVHLQIPAGNVYKCFADFSAWIADATLLVLRSFFDENMKK